MTWDEHRARYAELCIERNGLTVREYAESHGLNVNSARRELKGIKAAKRDQIVEKKSDQKVDQTSDQDGDHVAAKGRRKKSDQAVGRATRGGKNQAREAPNPKGRQKSSDHRSEKKIISPAPNGVDDSGLYHRPLPRGGRRFATGNEACIIHGRYANPRDVDMEDAIAAMEDPDFFDTLEARMIATNFAQLRLIERARNRSLDLLDADAAAMEGQPTKQEKDEDAPVQSGLHPVHKQLQMLLNAGVGISETAKAIAQLRTNMLKTRRDEDLHAIKLQQLDIVAMAYEEQKKKPEMTYTDMAAFIESLGGRVPPYMMQQARIEATQPPAPPDDTSTVPPEQLDAEARQYRAQREGKEEFLADRRALVAKIVDTNGFGDIDEQGAGREGEFIGTDFEDDEEFDVDATSDIYGEDDD